MYEQALIHDKLDLLLCVLQARGGKLVVLGSTHMFSDQYLDKEENGKILVSVMCPCDDVCVCVCVGG